MVNQNDYKILILKKQIEEKKITLKTNDRFVPVTNCSLNMDGNTVNINVLSKEQIVLLLVKLNSLRMSAKDLGILDDLIISGFSVNDWITDLKSRFSILNRKMEEEKLKKLETKLETFLSSEKKIELELDEISAILGSDK